MFKVSSFTGLMRSPRRPERGSSGGGMARTHGRGVSEGGIPGPYYTSPYVELNPWKRYVKITKFIICLSRQRKNKRMGAEKRGILLFLFLTSNETKIISIKKLKIRPEIKLTQVDFFFKSRFPSPSGSTEKKAKVT